jgi:hypothetical protein
VDRNIPTTERKIMIRIKNPAERCWAENSLNTVCNVIRG